MTLPWDEIITPNKVRQLQRTLYRKAKENGRWRPNVDSQTVNDLGEPDAGNPLVRFDEGRGVVRSLPRANNSLPTLPV